MLSADANALAANRSSIPFKRELVRLTHKRCVAARRLFVHRQNTCFARANKLDFGVILTDVEMEVHVFPRSVSQPHAGLESELLLSKARTKMLAYGQFF